MGYRQKTCPICSKIHNKRGEYCSKSCSNKARVVTPETKQKHSLNQQKYMNSVAAEEQKWKSRHGVAKYNESKKNPELAAERTLEDDMLMPSKYNLDNNQFISDGDIWTEVD